MVPDTRAELSFGIGDRRLWLNGKLNEGRKCQELLGFYSLEVQEFLAPLTSEAV